MIGGQGVLNSTVDFWMKNPSYRIEQWLASDVAPHHQQDEQQMQRGQKQIQPDPETRSSSRIELRRGW